MRKVVLGVVAITCATGSVIAGDMPLPDALYKVPAPVHSWVDWYFGLYFGQAGDVSTNPPFAFHDVGSLSAAEEKARSAPIPKAQRQTSDGSTAPNYSKKQDKLWQALDNPADKLGAAIAHKTPSVPGADNSLSVGLDGSNADGNYNRVGRATGDGSAGLSMKGTFSYKLDWQ
jgi:hypothetical protein